MKKNPTFIIQFVINEIGIVKKIYRNMLLFEEEDGSITKWTKQVPKLKSNAKLAKPKPRNKQVKRAPKKKYSPKPYEIKAAALPSCFVSLVRLNKADIDKQNALIKREFTVKKIRDYLCSMPREYT